MRILVVQESDWMERGPHQNHHLMERLSERGHEIRVIDFEIGWREKKFSHFISRRTVVKDFRKATSNGGVMVIRPSFLRLPLLDYVSIIITHRREIKRQIAEFKPDAIIGFGILNTNLAIRYARKSCIPSLYYVMDELHRLIRQKVLAGLARMVESHNMKSANITVSINEGLRDYTVDLGAKPERTRVIRAGIDKTMFETGPRRNALREELGIREDDQVLFFMGWLYRFSGLMDVASALGRLQANHPRLKLLVVGKGELWDDLQAFSRRDALRGRIILVDWIPYEQIPGYISASDICLLPAENRAVMKNIVPIKMYEYMASGKPVVSTRLPGVEREFGSGVGVTYVDEPRHVLDKSVEILEKGLAAEEGRKAQKHATRFDWNSVTNDFERLLIDLVENHLR